jgi:hypothetical protein
MKPAGQGQGLSETGEMMLVDEAAHRDFCESFVGSPPGQFARWAD